MPGGGQCCWRFLASCGTASAAFDPSEVIEASLHAAFRGPWGTKRQSGSRKGYF